ncbi:hypothetical protein ACTI_85470 [Actinoplanes sp. OR16]|uniref:baseplate J/gp47 family protein n=1 Tax=Actinoplanes sp. OR16 TaxID=946334 RepID=UPI000F6EDE25|nr:baseplate J/gp47 family protein [Actinoplanes sp. OR16]BBH71862.1 hypothetical protein ACTI_85470 [Actinoplanes sp. OR16]
MTFVAQPYERFVDDLLTALTGGVIREEHRFTGIEDTYSLGAPGAQAGGVTVFGQRGEQFVTFDPRTDWAYDTGLEAIVWQPGGRPPDPDSYFYVNYDLPGADRRLTDRNPGSVTTTLAEAFSRELAVLHKQMEMIYRSGFVDLADSASLDHVVALLGLARKDARFAAGEVLFQRGTPASGDIAVPAGTLVSTDQGRNFETSEKRTLRQGQLAVVVPVRAQDEGPDGRVEAGAIVAVNRPIFGIESVSNPGATFFATAKETDEQLRARARATLERAGRSTVDAIRYHLIERVDEVTEENIEVRERAETPGFVDVRLGLETTGPDLVRRVEEAILDARPAGVRVLHNLTSGAAAPAGAPVTGIGRPAALADFASAGTPAGAHAFTADELATQPEGILNLRAEVLLRPAGGSLSVVQKEELEDDARARVIAYVQALPMGEPLIFHKLVGRLVQPDGVADVALLVGLRTAGVFTGLRQNLDTTGRKATIGEYDVFAGLMEERVALEVSVVVEPAPGSDLAPEARTRLLGTLTDGGPVHRAVTAAVGGLLATARGSVGRGDLSAAVTAELGRLDPRLMVAAGDRALTVSALYTETGRLLDRTEQVTLAEYETPELTRLTITLAGGGPDVQG